jgi:hypothetical protein
MDISKYSLVDLLNYAGANPQAAGDEAMRRASGVGKKLKDILINDPKEYWIDEPYRYFVKGPEEVGYDAFARAREQLGAPMEEFTKADAAKHTAWQAETTRRLMERTGAPRELAAKMSNVPAVGKELLDVIGSAGVAFDDAKGQPFMDRVRRAGNAGMTTAQNSLMDLRNNDFGARILPLEGDIAQHAVNAAANATNSPLRALLQQRLYARD